MTERARQGMFPDYIGDGVYAHFDGFQVWLTTQEGMAIALEPVVQRNLSRYIDRVDEELRKMREQQNQQAQETTGDRD